MLQPCLRGIETVLHHSIYAIIDSVLSLTKLRSFKIKLGIPCKVRREPLWDEMALNCMSATVRCLYQTDIGAAQCTSRAEAKQGDLRAK